ncbi:Heavy metal RND efflux outer membrane protein, CzcC family [Acidisarcina polymorpha]|uniref:Heavy metal RND efflux outer membrane protein, CzcC family n=1 Tax=Acidisarcina polymorpha TaxID=2211140 RepID=A0A2Z5FVP4_9BACT|nr:efflux transporter outer membrane subunit [Acidisarcina polymorpha]AXC10938.1 Heavy metal RND efflux outer membrane protein, CzcC family [Acidisarcina polymorpha]
MTRANGRIVAFRSATERGILMALASASLLLAGCTVGPNYKRPDAPVPPAYKENGGTTATVPPPNGTWKQAEPADNVIRGKWWELYGDPQLNALEEKVAVSNQTLKAATEQYLSAREKVQVSRASYYPSLTVGPSASRERQSQNRPLHVPGSKSTYSDLVASGQASWEPDLWGNIRRNVEASRSNAQATAADLANVDLSIRAELASDYFELRGLDTDLQLLNDTVTAFQQSYELTMNRFKGGIATESDVALAQTQLQSTVAQSIDLGVARAQFEHAIATLIGVPASSFGLPPQPLNLNLPQLPTGVPSALLERRPDISGAERRAQAANAQIGIAIAAFYPNVTLSGSGGFESQNVTTWFQGPSSLWAIGGSAAELLFDGGRRRALTEEARHNYEQTADNYRESVLNAFQEVEDNLAALKIYQQEAVSQQQAVLSARRSTQISTNRYKGGTTAYLEVLTAQTAQLANERTAADLTTRQFAASVQLIRAVGGGWDTSQLPKF